MKPKILYDVWYETITSNSVERHFVARGLRFRDAHKVKREHKYRHYIHATESKTDSPTA